VRDIIIYPRDVKEEYTYLPPDSLCAVYIVEDKLDYIVNGDTFPPAEIGFRENSILLDSLGDLVGDDYL
jgi:hypothetical protein